MLFSCEWTKDKINCHQLEGYFSITLWFKKRTNREASERFGVPKKVFKK